MVASGPVSAKSTAKGMRRHLRGWQAGLLIVLLAGSAIVLATPRAVEPGGFPESRIDVAAINRVMAEDDALALLAARGERDVDVRALGRELRNYNEAAALAEEDDFAHARERVVDAAARLGQFGEQVRQLRAYQMRSFLVELRGWQATGVITEELRALSGDFIDAVVRSHWCQPASRELLLGERELRVLFKKRWNTVVGADSEELAPTLEEERVRLRFLLAYPFINNDPRGRGVTDRTSVDRLVAPQRMKTIDRLGALDPSYPTDLARAVVLYGTGQFHLAAEALRRHLDARPDGPYTLLARNYLKAALDQTVLPGL